MQKLAYLYAKMRNIFHCSVRKAIGLKRYKRSRYYGKPILEIDAANDLIYEKLISGEPFLAARFGDAELRTLVYTLENDMGFRKGFPHYIRKAMCLNAGFFPNEEEKLLDFGHQLWDSAAEVDLYGVWYNLLEDYVIHEQSPNATLCRLIALEPYRSIRPWSRALAGKRVLLVHPFEESIHIQYAKRELLFEDKSVLPEFELLTYKAVQTNAGGTCEYNDWFEALEGMFAGISAMDFDVAIVGCGAYGLPLAAKIKRMGKQVIHLAGATQIMFGIRGARWDARPEMQKFFNSAWIRPQESERPKDAAAVENGCYW